MIKNSEIQHLAKLARIKLDDADIELHKSKLESFFEYVESLKSVNTEGVRNMYHPIPDEFLVEDDMCNVFRADEEDESRTLDREEVLAEAPQTKDGMFEVPQIL